MITGELKSRVDRIWDAFWSGGISNPLEVMEQITYLLFVKRLDDLHTLEENKAARLGGPMARTIFLEGWGLTGTELAVVVPEVGHFVRCDRSWTVDQEAPSSLPIETNSGPRPGHLVGLAKVNELVRV